MQKAPVGTTVGAPVGAFCKTYVPR